MADKAEPNLEFDLSKGRVALSGQAYEDNRPLIVTTSNGLDKAIQFAGNLAGIPYDWLNPKLERFRARIRERVDAIPKENQKEPPLRIAYSALREAVIAAEETELQDLFANLLASACDDRVTASIHPGFATTIAELTPFDAAVLTQVAEKGELDFRSGSTLFPDRGDEFSIACVNLCRLGVTSWRYPKASRSLGASVARSMSNLRSGTIGRPARSSSEPVGITAGQTRQLARSMSVLGDNISREITKTQHADGIELTTFGLAFCRVCLNQPAL